MTNNEEVNKKPDVDFHYPLPKLNPDHVHIDPPSPYDGKDQSMDVQIIKD